MNSDATPGAPPGSPPDDATGGIPLLTQVVRVGATAVPAGTPAPDAPVAVPVEALPALEELSEDQLELLEQHIRENVLRGLHGRIDQVLESRIRDKLAGLLEQVLNGMTAELKTSLKETMRDVVARAVAQELSSTLAKRMRRTAPEGEADSEAKPG
jgi:hypothetical protein